MRKILIVDDEEDLCVLMRSYLKALGHEVYIASTLRDGIKEMERLKPDVIFLDNNLPDGKGWDMIDKIVQEFPTLKIHLISAYRQKNDILPTHHNVRIWEKPISLNTLDMAFKESP